MHLVETPEIWDFSHEYIETAVPKYMINETDTERRRLVTLSRCSVNSRLLPVTSCTRSNPFAVIDLATNPYVIWRNTHSTQSFRFPRCEFSSADTKMSYAVTAPGMTLPLLCISLHAPTSCLWSRHVITRTVNYSSVHTSLV